MKFKIINIGFAFLMTLSFCASGQNLFVGDPSAETETDTLTLGKYSSGLVPCFRDDSTAFDGKSSIRVDWDKKQRRMAKNPHWVDSWIATASSLDLKEGEPYTFSFYAKASADNYPFQLQMHPGAGYEYSVPAGVYGKDFTLSREWKRYSFSFVPKMQAVAPIKGYMAIFNFEKSPVGNVWYDAIQMEKGESPTPYKNSSPMNVGIALNSPHWSNIYSPDEPVVATISIAMPSEKAELQCRVVDYQGTVIKNFKQPVNGSNEIKLPLDNPRLGWFKVTAELSDSGKIISSHSANYIRIAKPVELVSGIQPYAGLINQQGYERFDISRKLGSKRTEIYADLKWIETAPGKYDWSDLEWHLKRGKESGMLNKVLVNPFSVPEWYFDKDELSKAKKMMNTNADWLVLGAEKHGNWREFIGELTRRYGGMIDEFELGAEDNGRLGKNVYYMSLYPQEIKKNSAGSPFLVGGKPFDDLCAMVKIGADEIRKTHPKMRIGAIRPSRSSYPDDLLFTREMFKKIGKDFNILPVDFYSYPFDFGPLIKDRRDKSDGLIEIYNDAKKITRELGCDQPIYMSEFGWFPDSMFPDDSIYRREQADTMPKDFIVARIAGYYAFDWFMGFCGVSGNKYSSSMEQNMKIQSVAASYSAVARVVENVTESKWLTPDNITRIAIMRKSDGKGVAAVWADKGYKLVLPSKSVFASMFGTELAATDVMGNPIQPAEGQFSLSQAPIYIWHDDFKELSEILAKSEVVMTEFCDIRFRMVSENMGCLQFANLSNTVNLEINAEITANGKTISKVIDVPKGSDNTCVFPLSGRSVKVKARKTAGKSVMEKSFELDKLTPIAAGVDAISPIATVNSRADLIPPDPWVPWSGPDDLSADISASWDNTTLYLKAKVKDDLHFNKNPAVAPWDADSLQIAIDPKNNGGFHVPSPGKPLGPDISEFGLALGDDGKSYCVNSIGKKVCGPDKYTIVRDEKAKTTTYEVRLAWNELGVKPDAGMVFGMSFVIFDDDNGAGQMYYAPVGGGIAGGKNPALYKKFVLK